MSFNETRYNLINRSKKLINLAEWLYRPNKPTCGDCIKLKTRKGRTPDCIKCGWVELLPENFAVMQLINKYSQTYVDSMNGSVDLKNILSTVELENVSDRHSVIQKILLFMKVAILTSKDK